MPLFSQPTQAEFMAATSFAGAGDFDPQVSPRANAEWAAQLRLYSEAQRYFYGDIFDKRSGNSVNAPLLYPLKLNLVRMMCLTHAAALWGQWEDELITFTSQPENESQAAKDRAEQARTVIAETYEASGGQTILYEGGLSQQIYGGIFLRAAVDPAMPHGIRIDKLMPYNVFCVWHPIITNRILEAFIAIPIDKAEAALAYGIQVDALPDEVVYLEHWTDRAYETSIGGKLLREYRRTPSLTWSATIPWCCTSSSTRRRARRAATSTAARSDTYWRGCRPPGSPGAIRSKCTLPPITGTSTATTGI